MCDIRIALVGWREICSVMLPGQVRKIFILMICAHILSMGCFPMCMHMYNVPLPSRFNKGHW